ncbi:MAG: hypothetical protein HRU19_27140 [Pseudobacteriovorax sp.]|nr:hypothetical protein [Pseudobacteriovorax sp.]
MASTANYYIDIANQIRHSKMSTAEICEKWGTAPPSGYRAFDSLPKPTLRPGLNFQHFLSLLLNGSSMT